MSSEALALLAHEVEVDLSPGCVVGGRYELVRELGRGASGVVWLANHSLLASEVAVKFLDSLHDSAHDADFLVERFRFEAQVSARLGRRTDRIVAVHDGGMFRGMPFIVMDFIEGESAETMLERTPMPASQVALLVRHVADALEAAHQEGIAHRDVKPGNILAVHSGSAVTFKLADFGIAKLFGSVPKGVLPPRCTAEQTLVGSPAYMSPETISSIQPSNGSADTWALAVTAYECLTQRLPFAGEAWPSIAVSIMSGRHELPSTVLGVTGSAFDSFFQRAFAANIADRFTSPGELASAFEATATAASDDRPRPAASLSTTQDSLARDELALPKNKWGWPAAAAGAAALLLVGGAAWLLRGPDPAPARSAHADAVALSTPGPVAKDPPLLGATDGVFVVPGPASTAADSAAPSAAAPKGVPRADVANLQRSARPRASAPASPEVTAPRVTKPPRAVDPSDTQ